MKFAVQSEDPDTETIDTLFQGTLTAEGLSEVVDRDGHHYEIRGGIEDKSLQIRIDVDGRTVFLLIGEIESRKTSVMTVSGSEMPILHLFLGGD